MTRRRARGALLAALVGVAALLLAPGSARAGTGTAFTLPANKTVKIEEPAIPGNDPASATADEPPDPDSCPVLPACQLVPMHVDIPQRKQGDDFVVYLEFSWEQPSGTEDIDFWVYDNGQTAKKDGSSGYTVIGSSASGDMPEKVKLFEPLLGDYNIVANAFTGAIPKWNIKAQSTVGVFDKPFESLAPTPGGGTSNPTPTTTAPRSTATTVATTTTVTVPEGAIIPDDDFEGGKFDPNSVVDDAIAAGQDARAATGRRSPAAQSPSAIAVIGWMLLLPAAVIGGGFLAIRARKRGRYAPASTSST